MATSYRTLDTDSIQVRTIYARTSKNAVIPSSHILIADGNGATHWSSISTILEISSFRTIKGNNLSTFSADMSYNVLQISTTGVQGLFESYVDPTTSTLMLSNVLPPIGVNLGRVPAVSLAAAANLPTGSYFAPESGNSTLKFLGVGDILLSSVTSYKATFISISSFTSAGYSTISGETFALRPLVASTFSTAQGRPSFISSIAYDAGLWTWGSNIPMSTSGRDLYFSSVGFYLSNANFLRYLDTSPQSTTKFFVDFTPSFLFTSTTLSGTITELAAKEVSTYLQIGGSNLPESVVSHYMTLQAPAVAGFSNSFTTPIRLQADPYGSLSTAIGNLGIIQVQLYHRIVNGAYSTNTTIGIDATSNMANLSSRQGAAYMTLFNSAPLAP